jgi:2-polyprenyl-6-methoxyphenol hydroxylase-like FAD-dependent oxidoreductase
VGDVSVLKQYEEDRRVANAVMLTAVDGLKRVWGTSFVPLAALRNVGLKLTDSFSPLKKEMMKFAVGSFDTSAIGGAHVPGTTST